MQGGEAQPPPTVEMAFALMLETACEEFEALQMLIRGQLESLPRSNDRDQQLENKCRRSGMLSGGCWENPLSLT
jgi:hypothetical protein